MIAISIQSVEFNLVGFGHTLGTECHIHTVGELVIFSEINHDGIRMVSRSCLQKFWLLLIAAYLSCLSIACSII